MSYKKDFIKFMMDCGVLSFGDFTLKSGRKAPYFINTGNYKTGAQAAKLGEFYAQCSKENNIEAETLFGPAYKGIPLAVSCAIALYNKYGTEVNYCFDRKEAKDHGEGGNIIGTPLAGRVLIIDDVISAGISVRESVEILRDAGATPCGVLIALDRMERGTGLLSATQEVEQDYRIPVVAVASLDDLMAFLKQRPDFAVHEAAVARYRQEYGVEKIG